MVTLRDIFEERMNQFVPEYSFTEQDEVVRSLAVVGELLDLLFSGAEAALTMTALKRIISHGEGRDWDWAKLNGDAIDNDWRATWKNIDGWNDSSSPPFLDELHDLNAFANFGVIPTWGLAGNPDLTTDRGVALAARLKLAEDVPAYIEGICCKIDKITSLLARHDGSGHPLIGQTLLTRDQARARLALDQNQPITLHALALLSGVTAKRIQNAIYAKTDEAPLVGKNGLIAPEACEPWLNARDYHWSIWNRVSSLGALSADWGRDVPFEDSDPNPLIEDYIFVPVANDGSYFSPVLHRKGREKASLGGFSIGPKGAEEVVEGFDEALERLAKMETPRWRRPNPESGIWGIVSGQTWKRTRKVDLEQVS